MRFRTNILPRTIGDIGAFTLINAFIPLTAIHGLLYVLPSIHEVGSLPHIFAVSLGLFILFNLISNMIGVIMVDTSIKGEILTPPTNIEKREFWRLCALCETLCPPRSWHCETCKTCILKRDHHCVFTGCCIGYRNHRYFLMFLLYLCFGTLFTTIYLSFYTYFMNPNLFSNFFVILKMIFPMYFLIPNLIDDESFFLVIFEINLIGFLYSLVLLVYHFQIMLKGGVGWEIERGSKIYDLGWKKNFELVFGKRMCWVWLSAFIRSELPMDGIHWEDIIENSIKNK